MIKSKSTIGFATRGTTRAPWVKQKESGAFEYFEIALSENKMFKRLQC